MIENIVDKGKAVSMFLVVLLLLTSLSSTAYAADSIKVRFWWRYIFQKQIMVTQFQGEGVVDNI